MNKVGVQVVAKDGSYRPHRLRPRNRRLLRLIATGMPVGEAAEQCGYSLSRASIILNSPLGQEYVRDMEKWGAEELFMQNAEMELNSRAVVMKRLEAELPETLEQLIALRDGPDARVALGAVNSMLDRAGISAKQSVSVEQKIVADEGVVEALKRLGILPMPAAPQAAATE